jgi:citrate/tricarballylate utilization protein
MPGLDLFEEANRQLTLCNACRYCEGYCAVFQAIELRRDFEKGDVFYLSNLCHDCRACYYACMFSPPHEFAINIPKVLSEARLASYKQWSWPEFLGRAFGGRRVAWLLAGITAAVVLALSFALIPAATLWRPHDGSGAFYAVIPYAAMVVGALGLASYWLVIWLNGAVQCWREIAVARGTIGGTIGWKPLARATGAALGLRYLRGGGPGCTYPDEKPSAARRIFHALVFWGFLADFVSTTLAYIYQDWLHELPPYSLGSAPVIFGAAGGVALLAGSVGLIWLKARSDREPMGAGAYGLDYDFLCLLGLTALTGLLTLAVRSTAAMGSVLALHLALVAALFITAPYGKFVHAIYRFLALVKHYAEADEPRASA